MDKDQRAEIHEAVREVLRSEAGVPLGELGSLVRCVANTERDVGLLVTAAMGPVLTDWRGNPDPDGQRDYKAGSAWRSEEALDIATRTQHQMDNGGIPAKLSRIDRAAIWGAGGTITAALITAFFIWINSL